MPLAALLALAMLGVVAIYALQRFGMAPGGAATNRPPRLTGPLFLALIALAILWTVGVAWLASRRALDGIRLERSTERALFARIDAISAALGCRAPDRVLLSHGLNAGIMAQPRLLPFRRRRIVLVLGIELLESLTPAQFDSVLAHELAHQRPGEFAFPSRVGTIVAFWTALAERSGAASGWLHRIVSRYAERLDIAAQAMRRRVEFEVDRAAAAVVGVEPTIEALARTAVFARLLQRFSADAVRRAAGDPSYDHARAIADRRRFFLTPPAAPDAARLQTEWAALRRMPPNDDDGHPTVAERIASLRFGPSETERSIEGMPLPAGAPRALEALFGGDPDRAPPIARVMLQDAAAFEAAVEDAREEAPRLEELDRMLDRETPPALDRRELEAAIDEWLGRSAWWDPPEATIRRARRATRLLPEYGDAWAALATALLAEDDREGVVAAKRAIELEAVSAPQVTAALATFHARRGDRDRALLAWEAQRGADDRSESAAREIAARPKADSIDAADLGTETRERLASTLRGQRAFGKAWLVRRRLEHAPGLPHYLLVVQPRFLRFSVSSNDEAVAAAQTAVDEIAGIPGPVRVILARSLRRRVRARIRNTPGAPLA